MRKDIQKLVYKIEKQVVGILITHGYVTSKSKTFVDIDITQKGKALLGVSDPLITEQWLKDWRYKWPSGFRGTPKIIRTKINKFLRENKNTSLDDINNATDTWLAQKPAPYCGDAKYFFYKKDSSGGEQSRCEEVLEEMKDDTISVEDDSDFSL